MTIQPHDDQAEPIRLLRIGAVCERIGIRHRSVWRLVSVGAFPAPAHVGRAAVWSDREIDDYIRIAK